MTCEHIITNEIIENNRTIEIYYDNQKNRIKIELNKNERFIKNFLDLNIDCTIVEILPNDNVNEDNFLIPNIDYSNNLDNLKKKKIYIPQYPNGGNLSYSRGIIKNIKRYQFSYNASTLPGSSGSPIFLIQTTYVIGIHKGGDESKKENYGNFIFPIINYLNNLKKENEIKIIIFITLYQTLLFGEEFIKNNNDKCEIIINGKNGFELNNLTTISPGNGPKEIILKEIKEITDMSFMFSPVFTGEIQINFSKWDVSNVTNMKYMFRNCDNIYGISKWNVSNVKDMSYLFSECKCRNFPDISEWDVSNVKDMSYMFSEYELINFPAISKWNVSSLTNMEGMFYNCVYLNSLPNISNWDISNVKNISKIFDECKSLKSLSDISKWNTSNIIEMSYMFHNCLSLNSFPNISNWNILNVKNMSHMFHNCWSLNNIPGIENWNISNVSDMSLMFHNCSIDFNEIKKWNISKLQNSYQMFSNFDNYNSDDRISVYFRSSFGINCCLIVNRDMLIEDLIDKYLKKINRIYKSEKLSFIFNSTILYKYNNLRINDYIKDNSSHNITIQVNDRYNLMGG